MRPTASPWKGRGAASSWSVPDALNGLLLISASAAGAFLLWAASHAPSVGVLLACALLFSLVGNTLFSLLHEAVHGSFSRRVGVNEWAGRLAAAWFPTGLSIQRAFHLTHHRNNRSASEQFDVIHEGDVRWLKYAQWYAILTGVYWLTAVLGVICYLLIPRMLRLRILRRSESRVALQTASGEYLAALDGVRPVPARLEILFSFAFQGTLATALDLSLVGWAACYGAFALAWSSLQYADHAFSPLDREEGAWNLRVSSLTRAFYLNYHFHRAHHQNPQVPWIHLPKLVDPSEPQPTFWRIWWAMWKGPREGAP
ncbi:MAG: fatty acid desaturase [Acidobacteria bacterium]|nr:fatty acid desaturase [Acidobacteriota bacterium]